MLPNTARSSAILANQLLKGSGLVLMASRVAVFVPCAAKAMVPPAKTAANSKAGLTSPKVRAAKIAPDLVERRPRRPHVLPLDQRNGMIEIVDAIERGKPPDRKVPIAPEHRQFRSPIG